MNRGDPIQINTSSPMFPEGWKRGEKPIRVPNQPTFGIYLSEEKERGVDPRTFYRVVTPFGICQVNSKFCKPL